MSALVLHQNGLRVTRFCGPESLRSPFSDSRMMVNITSELAPDLGKSVSLTMDQWINLVCFIRRMDDKEGMGITNAPEVE